jgi:hypothetical protein
MEEGNIVKVSKNWERDQYLLPLMKSVEGLNNEYYNCAGYLKSEYSTPALFVSLHIAVLFVCIKVIVVIFMRCGTVLSVLHRHTG